VEGEASLVELRAEQYSVTVSLYFIQNHSILHKDYYVHADVVSVGVAIWKRTVAIRYLKR
jgi:hypothetical protein